MDRTVLSTFQRQVADQAALGLRGLAIMHAGLTELDAAWDGIPDRSALEAAGNEVWAGVQIFVTASGNVSKALWGSGGERAGRRADLRSSLGVLDESPLRGFTFRNHFEHFDERIDRWASASDRRVLLDRHIGPADSVSGPEGRERLRVLDPEAGILYFWGDQFDIAPIADELTRLLGRAGAAAD
ncbi:hypothetical protein KZC52_14135 [Microbacterium sp. kSW2-24]|uniref:hypothetical protein n=1 Tax=Microbacterium galbinum TaxID=2851646 RepID=UPI001FFDE1C5|nr:hypothetical protein [Microbacterium galbinum]MCK2024074.1 hypothetical protein [Microbacterium galbinum]